MQEAYPDRKKLHDKCVQCEAVLDIIGRHCGAANCPWCATCAKKVES